MAHDTAQAEPQAVLEPTAHDIAAPAPARAPAPAPAHTSRAGWILSTVVATGAAWAIGWVAGVSWAWREMLPRHLTRVHRRRMAGHPGGGTPGRS